MKIQHLLITVIFTIVIYHFAEGQSTIGSSSIDNYNIKEGQWVKYGPLRVDVKSDSPYLKLIAKAILSKGELGASSSGFNTSLSSLQNIEWLFINISKITGYQVTTEVSMKPKLSSDISSNYFTNPITASDKYGLYSLYLPKTAKIGDTIYTTFANESFPLTVNDTKEKSFGNRVVQGYDVVGTRNSYNETNASANEKTIRLFFDRETGRPLDINLNIQLGMFLGTVEVEVKLSAIDWS